MTQPEANPIAAILVEDDAPLRETLAENLRLRGLRITAVDCGLAFYRALADDPAVDVAVIDLGLPDQQGDTLIDYCRRNTRLSLIVITASDSLARRIDCYRVGADLFMGKPVDGAELAAAIESLGQRQRQREPDAAPSPETRLRIGAWSFEPASQRLLDASGREVDTLTWGENQILTALARAQGHAVPRASLLAELQRGAEEPNPETLNALIYRLRRKLAGAADASPIQTLSGLGYRLRLPD